MRALPILALVLLSSAFASAQSEARPPHPEPRVIVRVESVNGPHKRNDVERAARLGWGRIVRCYKASPLRPRGALRLELRISGKGSVQSSRRMKSTLGDPELASCVTKAMSRVAMPKARRASRARVEIQLAPGDPESPGSLPDPS